MNEIKITTWELPKYARYESIVSIKGIILSIKPLEYVLYERQPQLYDFDKVKRMVASEMASFMLNFMEYEVIEEYDGRYTHKFKTKCLVEQEKDKYLTEISDLKTQLEEIKLVSDFRESRNKRLQYKINRVKNYSFWERVKFLFKKKGELL